VRAEPLALGPRARMLEAAATGAWLGLTQAALGFALLAGAGASAALFFALLGAWLAGGVAGSLGVSERGRAGSAPGRALLLGLSLLGAASARGALWRWPFSSAPVWAGLAAGSLAGAYAARFLRDRAEDWGSPRTLLLHENNGFLVGYMSAGGLLFVSARALWAAVLLGGLLLLAWSLLDARRAQGKRG